MSTNSSDRAESADRMSRRQIMATILLTGNPNWIRQGSGDHADKLYIEFDSIADLRAWLAAAGLNTANLNSTEWPDHRTGEARMCAWPTWYGWPITASATNPAPATADLPKETVADLTALAEVEGGAR